MSRVETLSKAMVNYFISFMIWLFTLFVFIPLAEETVKEPPLGAIVAFICLMGMVYSTYKGSALLLEYRESLPEGSKRLLRLGILEAVIVLDCVLVTPVVWKISSIIGGLTLITFVAATLFYLFISVQEDAALETDKAN